MECFMDDYGPQNSTKGAMDMTFFNVIFMELVLMIETGTNCCAE
jgi:hypothetical protein